MTNIFVGNLSFETTQDDLVELFSQFGNVERASIITDRATGQPRGFGFVEMTNRNEADQAISSLNGSVVRGRPLNVNEARPKAEGGGGGGFSGNKRRGAASGSHGGRGESRW